MQNNTNENTVSVHGVHFAYYVRRGYLNRQKIYALKGIDLEVRKGEALGVVGVNGAGKSTLLKLMAGIYKPDKGSINTYNNSISMLSLQAGFIPYLNGRTNVMLSGLTLGLTKSMILEKMDEIRGFAELGEYFDMPVSSYSSGMKARLGFSIGFQMNPEVLLIDEVFGVGDASFQDKSSKLMRQKVRSNNSVVMVAHNDQIVRKLCDRAVMLFDGKIYEEGDVNTVMDKYKEFLQQYKRS